MLIAVALLTTCGAFGGGVARATTAGATAAANPAAQIELNAAELDSLTAPIAVYSDPLLAEVLTAATYSAQVADASRWLDHNPLVLLAGRASRTALQKPGWSASVKALLAVPHLLRMMGAHPCWVARLGAAFREQPAAVIQAVQRLRHRALTYGTLFSTVQQTVTVSADGADISIVPAQPDVIYVSYYWPLLVYGPWLRSVRPYVFAPPRDIAFGGGAPIAFGLPVNVTSWPWRWFQWDWHRQRLEALTSAGTIVPW